ncbi:hypothetical protein BB737_23605 [Mycobacterium avium subsp. hominissuis]|uniref:Uncharacterized protein n=1 Tax=Mycobacterium avium TaxID=1764 RepID=A0A2A2ZKZ7_MYCAV|nr:hypothetical protein BEP52_11280 [Mycobacterium avium subsp. hominissuis]ETA96920.1 hypothetical protein O982_15010 [Mycobacterium avium 10-5581]PBA27073.1 hypothetical protein CKJ66_09365 [Mycobacterium avium]BAN31229.1 hypothetical protein MAH_2155 [Mycobacterium avium subsp. hominissuis TH135]ATO72513.1 hypothetical protein BJP74_14550 [Mycobacterium avium subsp. hominissuis]
MCPSTEHTDEQRAFAADVLRKLLQHIVNQNQFANAAEGHYTFLVSHAWTEGPMMYLVYQAPPSDISWGLVRDTRESILDPSPWPDVDEAVLYYYLLDLEENWPGHFSRQPGESDTICWRGDRHPGLPEHPSDIDDEHRYTPTAPSLAQHRPEQAHPVVNEPRLYADPP